MASRLPPSLTERVLARHPLPIADAVAALEAAENLHERRDRVVEVFRAAVRTLAANVLAVRVQYGTGPGDESPQVAQLLRLLRRRGLTDGQWVGLIRETLRSWKSDPATYSLPGLVELFHGRNSPASSLLDGLMTMRKEETVAHGESGDDADLVKILEIRVPQLQRLLEALDPLWSARRLVVPLARPQPTDEQLAWLFIGDTPGRGRWRRIALHSDADLPAGQPVLIDTDNRPVVALNPLILVRRPSPDAVEECFYLDGGSKRGGGAVYLAVPSMARHTEAEAWRTLETILDKDVDATPAALSGRPYRGLDSFGPEHSDRFYGREGMAECLANRIRRHPFITVTGPSGCGKTSLLQAGVLPQLERYTPVIIRPGAQPLRELERALSLVFPGESVQASLGELLQNAPATLGNWLTASCHGSERRVVIVVDQGEELLTLCENPALQLSFAAAIVSAGCEPDGPVRVVYCLREDFFGRLAALEPLRGRYSRQVEVVTTPDREALIRTLVGPLSKVGYTFESPQLVEQMVDAVEGEPAALALLQFCADQMWRARDRTWKRLTWDAYHRLGGVEGALASHADRVLEQLTPSQKIEVRQILLRMVTGDDTRAVCSRDELLQATADRRSAEQIIDRLVEERVLVVREADDSASVLELVHEALIQHWTQLAGWLSDDREGRRTLMALRTAANDWERRGCPRALLWRGEVLEDYRVWRRHSVAKLTDAEARFAAACLDEESRARRSRRMLISTAVIVLALFGVFMWWQWRTAEVERAVALAAQVESEERTRQAQIGQLQAKAAFLETEREDTEAMALWRAAYALELTSPAERAADTSSRSRLTQFMFHHVTQSVWCEAGTSPWASIIPAPRAYYKRVIGPDGLYWCVASTNNWSDHQIWDVSQGALRQTIEGVSQIESLSYNSTRTTMAVSTRTQDDNNSTFNTSLWSLIDGTLIAKVPGKTVQRASQSALLTVDEEGVYRAWDFQTGKLLVVLDGYDPPKGRYSASELWTTALTAGGAFLVTADRDGRVDTWDVSTGEKITQIVLMAGRVNRPSAFDPTLNYTGTAIAVEFESAVQVFDVATGQVTATLNSDESGPMMSVAFSPDGNYLASGHFYGEVRLWHVGSDTVRTIGRHTEGVDRLAFSRDSSTLATGCSDGNSRGTGILRENDPRALVWDVKTGHQIAVLDGHHDGVQHLEFGVDRSILLTTKRDGMQRIWSVARPLYEFHPGVWPLESIVFRPDGKQFVGHSGSRLFAADDIEGKRPRLGNKFGDGAVFDYSPDGATMLSVVWDMGADRLSRWDVSRGIVLKTLEVKGSAIKALAFSSDGDVFATGHGDGTIQLWNAATWEVVATLGERDQFSRGVRSLHFHPDGVRLVAGEHRTKSVRIWDTSQLTMTASYPGGLGKFSPDGAVLAVVSDKSVDLLDTQNFERIRTLEGHTGSIFSLAFHPDGTTLATGAQDHTIRLWDLAERTSAVIIKENDTISSVAFNPAGTKLVSGDWSGAIRARDVSFRRWTSTELLSNTGVRTNFRVCRETFKVVPLLPFPSAESVWVEDVLSHADASPICDSEAL